MSKKARKLRLNKPKIGEFNISGFKVIITHPLPSEINIQNVIMELKKSVPSVYYDNLDCIYIGEFSFLKDRQLTAMYKDQVFYVSNEQDSEEDLVDDLVHETAHLVEEDHTRFIYEDNRLLSEFLSKREQLYNMLDSDEKFSREYTLNYTQFLNPDYDISFDNFIYNIIGYEQIVAYTMNIFYSPYAVTSLREYFANGFEAYYYHRDLKKLKNLSPVLYNKISNLEDNI